MGRKRNPVYQYFTIDDNKTGKCGIGQCGTVLTCTNASNLENHLKAKHKVTYEEFKNRKLQILESSSNLVTKKKIKAQKVTLEVCMVLI
jgi:hypothetical protein